MNSGDDGYCGEGIYFTSMNGFGSHFGKINLECYLNIKNPLIIEELSCYEKEQLIKYLAENTPDYFVDDNIPRLEGYPKQSEEYYSERFSDLLKNSFSDPKTEELRSSLLSSYEYQDFLDTGNIDSLKYCDEFLSIKKKREFEDFCEENGLAEYVFTEPYSVDDLTSNNFHHGYWEEFSKQITNWAKENGYDGILSERNENNRVREIVVFYPNQIKSIDNLYPTKDDNFVDNSEDYFKNASLDERIAAAEEMAACSNNGKEAKAHDNLEL